MRGLKTTIALVVVLGGLLAYIYYVTWKQPEGGAIYFGDLFDCRIRWRPVHKFSRAAG